MNDFLKNTKNVLSGRKGKALIILFAVGAALLIFSFVPQNDGSQAEDKSLYEYKRELEEELTKLCQNVDGVGKCKVMISFSEGERLEYKAGELISVSPPKVQGVSILCEGGARDSVKAELTELASALFDIGKNRICILKIS